MKNRTGSAFQSLNEQGRKIIELSKEIETFAEWRRRLEKQAKLDNAVVKDARAKLDAANKEIEILKEERNSSRRVILGMRADKKEARTQFDKEIGLLKEALFKIKRLNAGEDCDINWLCEQALKEK
jgi:uncharacterized coiled-coil DUF342 family protein